MGNKPEIKDLYHDWKTFINENILEDVDKVDYNFKLKLPLLKEWGS